MALKQDPQLILPILEYRLIERAKDIIHPDAESEHMVKWAEKVQAKHPELVRLWLEMTRAGQDGE